jgi:hypothetical protein
MSQATEDRIIYFTRDLMRHVEDSICKEWGDPPAGEAYLAAEKQFRAQIENRIRANEWLKE